MVFESLYNKPDETSGLNNAVYHVRVFSVCSWQTAAQRNRFTLSMIIKTKTELKQTEIKIISKHKLKQNLKKRKLLL